MNDAKFFALYAGYNSEDDLIRDSLTGINDNGMILAEAILSQCDYDFNRFKKWLITGRLSALKQEARANQ